MKKFIAVLLSVCIVSSCFVFGISAAVTGQDAADIAKADFTLSYGESSGEITADAPCNLYDENDSAFAFLVCVHSSGTSLPVISFDSRILPVFRYTDIAYVVSADGEILSRRVITDDSVTGAPEGGKLYYCSYYGTFWMLDADGTITDEDGVVCSREQMNATFVKARAEQQARREREELEDMVENTESVHDFLVNGKKLGIKKIFDYILGLLKRFCAYVLNDWVRFPSGWDKTGANAAVDDAVREYCEENNCTVKEVYRIDKDYFVPNRQRYFSDGEYVGDGVCGVASWEMILGGYRDMGILADLPDDITMYREIMDIMDGITEELIPKVRAVISRNSFLVDKVVNPVLSNFSDVYLDDDIEFEAYEVLGALDIGIAMYLNQYGYTEYARRVLANLTIGVPVLTPARRALFMREIKNTVSGWIYRKTDGKLNLPTGMGSAVPDTVIRSLERGEPAIIGCWMSVLGDDDLTNHYFVAASLYKVETELKINDKKSVIVERNLIEIYDTWDNNSVELVDFDAMFNTTLTDANTLALLF